MNDDQPTQPLTDAELSALRDYIERTNHGDNLKGDARRLLAEVGRLRAEVAGYRSAICFETTCTGCAGMLDQLAQADSEVDRLRVENHALLRKLEEQYRRRAQSANEIARLRLEAVQMESGSQIAMNSGVAALQEVKRLEIVCDDLKLINDRMAEDRLRLIDERDSILADLQQYSQLHWENCPLDEKDCYLCEGYERIRANARDRKAASR